MVTPTVKARWGCWKLRTVEHIPGAYLSRNCFANSTTVLPPAAMTALSCKTTETPSGPATIAGLPPYLSSFLHISFGNCPALALEAQDKMPSAANKMTVPFIDYLFVEFTPIWML